MVKEGKKSQQKPSLETVQEEIRNIAGEIFKRDPHSTSPETHYQTGCRPKKK